MGRGGFGARVGPAGERARGEAATCMIAPAEDRWSEPRGRAGQHHWMGCWEGTVPLVRTPPYAWSPS